MTDWLLSLIAAIALVALAVWTARVRNSSIEPHLINGDAFDAYRAALRGIVVSKPAVVEAWPPRPQTIWSTEIQG